MGRSPMRAKRAAFRIVADRDFSVPCENEKQALAIARERARPVVRQWLRRVKLEVTAGWLLPIDLLVAEELTDYPSANEGRCYAGQERLARALGCCPRTVRSSLARLRA